MLRLFFTKNILITNRKNIVYFYKKVNIFFNKTYVNSSYFYRSNVNISLPKRQQHFNFFDIKLNSEINFSAGRYLLTLGQKSKFFKRNHKNVLSIILQLKKNFLNMLRSIFFFSLKNFNHRQYSFFKRFNIMLKPDIHYFLHKRSFMPLFLPKRRIRRRVLRLLKRNQ